MLMNVLSYASEGEGPDPKCVMAVDDTIKYFCFYSLILHFDSL